MILLSGEPLTILLEPFENLAYAILDPFVLFLLYAY